MIPPGLYGIADAGWGDPWEQWRLLDEEGVGVVQLRCKGWPRTRLLELARRCRGRGLLVVNDDAVVAAEVGAFVHLGQADGDAPGLPFGRSTHTAEQAAAAHGAAYIGFGPLFPSRTKSPGHPPRGTAMLAEVVRASPRPVVAIGGIARENLDAVRATGVHGWAVIGAIWSAPDPRAAIRAFR